MELRFTLLLITYTVMVGTSLCTVYNVVPSPDNYRQCEDNHCITLTEFATNSSHYLDTINTTLILEPGNHMLTVDMKIYNISQFGILSRYSSVAMVKCLNSAKIVFINSTLIFIHAIRFAACGENLFAFVNLFILKNATFTDHLGQDSSTALQLLQTAVEIIDCSFINLDGTLYNNSVSGTPATQISYGGAILSFQSNLTIIRSTFQSNSATLGGALFAGENSKITILNTTFTKNQAKCQNNSCSNENVLIVPQGGALMIQKCDLIILHAVFDSNCANVFGGAIGAIESNISIAVTTFVENSVTNDHNNSAGGAVSAIQSIVTFNESFFHFNRANYGGVIVSQDSSFVFLNNVFTYNNAKLYGGVFRSHHDHIHVVSCQFINNTARYAGSISALSGSSITAEDSLFTNSTSYGGGVLVAEMCTVNFSRNTLSHNYAVIAGVLFVYSCNVTMTEGNFLHNIGKQNVIEISFSKVTVNNIFIGNNRAMDGSVVIIRFVTYSSYGIVRIANNSAIKETIKYEFCQANIHGETIFNNNSASIAILNSNFTFSGITYITNCSKPASLLSVLQAQFSVVSMRGTLIIANNQARKGSAINIVESRLLLYGKTIIRNNTALFDAGGIFLYKSELNCKENSTLSIYGNTAGLQGGAISAWSSSILVTLSVALQQNDMTLMQGSVINIFKNQAKIGGGLSFWNSRFYIFSDGPSHFGGTIGFTDNLASLYGGAIYVNDYYSSVLCKSNRTEYFFPQLCFLQVIMDDIMKHNGKDYTYIHFSQNNASIAGSAIFGGLLDRCSIQNGSVLSNLAGTSFIKSVTDIVSLDSISSFPIKVCFCQRHIPNCSYTPPPIYIMKGYPFKLSMVAIDQVKKIVKFSNIVSLLSSGVGNLGIDQRLQKTKEACTDLTFNVFSPNTSAELIIFAQGPCGAASPSVGRVKVRFLPCTCPVGFQPTHADETKCECDCDPELPYKINTCDPHHESLVREGNFWITYVNNSKNNSSGYIGYSHCPMDYCLPASSKVNITLSKPNGSDLQCAFNRSGLLCGRCKPHYSISLGSSHCIQCSNGQLEWLTLLIIVAAIIGGLLLVVLLLILNLTVAKGTLNGIIFYANIAYANKSTLFQFSRPNFISVILSWLNLEIGLDICFYNGMDMYWKTWIQLAFSAYLFILLGMIIIISERSTILSNVLRRKNPVATLATLVLLSYTKLLHIIISALSSAVIKYPDGSKKVVWLPDATLEYWSGKHIALFVTAVTILLVGILYTIILFSWQWLLPRSDWKLLRWIKNQKLCIFIETYYAPYNFRHRYWTGFLLMVRIILSVVSAVNISGDPAINLVANCVLLITVIMLKLCLQGKKSVYITNFNDILESICVINLLTFSAFKLFFLAENSSQIFIAYLSGTLIIIKFGLVLASHIWTEMLTKTKVWSAIKNCREKRMRGNDHGNELRNLLTLTSDEEDEVVEPTFTIIERLTHQKPLSELVEARNSSEEDA